MADYSSIIAASIIARGKSVAEARGATFGDPADHQARRVLGTDAVLRAAGVYEGRPLDHTVLAAIELQNVVMGLLSTKDPVSVLGEGVGVMAYLGRAIAAEVGKTDAEGVVQLARKFSSATAEPRSPY